MMLNYPSLSRVRGRYCLVTFFLLAVFLFNIASNIIPIIVLVYFRLLPGTAMHDIAGLACFALYIIVPAAFLTRHMVQRYGRVIIIPELVQAPLKYRISVYILLLAFIAIPVLISPPHQPSLKLSAPHGSFLKYDTPSLDGNVTKLSNDSVLIYIKPIMGFYSSDHHPMIC